MSRGPGIVQHRLRAALEAEPARRFTVEELAALAYPGEEISRVRLSSVRRALSRFPTVRCRFGRMGERGWRHSIMSKK